MKKPIFAASLVLSLAMTCVAQNQVVNCIAKKNATWSDASSWQNGSLPSDENELAIINGGFSSIVDSPFEAPIRVQVGNGRTPSPDGTLIINSDFRVKFLGVATADGTSGRVEQSSGIVSLEELSLSALSPEPLGATYDLIGGKLETEMLRFGVTGPANINLEGNGEIFTVHIKFLAGSQSAIRLVGTQAGFPCLNAATAHITIEPGATLTVEGAGAATKPGKFILIEAKEPLAGKLDVNLTGFVAGKATVLENEPGVVIEVK
jgi:hypothetical protein